MHSWLLAFHERLFHWLTLLPANWKCRSRRPQLFCISSKKTNGIAVSVISTVSGWTNTDLQFLVYCFVLRCDTTKRVASPCRIWLSCKARDLWVVWHRTAKMSTSTFHPTVWMSAGWCSVSNVESRWYAEQWSSYYILHCRCNIDGTVVWPFDRVDRCMRFRSMPTVIAGWHMHYRSISVQLVTFSTLSASFILRQNGHVGKQFNDYARNVSKYRLKAFIHLKFCWFEGFRKYVQWCFCRTRRFLTVRRSYFSVLQSHQATKSVSCDCHM